MQILAGNINKPRLKRSYSDTDLAKMKDITSVMLPFKKIDIHRPIDQTVRQDLPSVKSSLQVLNQPNTISYIDQNKSIKDYKEFSYYIAAQSQMFMRENILNFKIKEFLNNITGKYASVNLKRIPEINNDRKALLSFYRQAKDPMTKNCILQTFDNLPEYIKVNDFLIPTKIENSMIDALSLRNKENYLKKDKDEAYEVMQKFLEEKISKSTGKNCRKSKENLPRLENILTKLKNKNVLNQEEINDLKQCCSSKSSKKLLFNIIKENKKAHDKDTSFLMNRNSEMDYYIQKYMNILSHNFLDDDELNILEKLLSERKEFLDNCAKKGRENLSNDKYSADQKNLINLQVKLMETLLEQEFPKDDDFWRLNVLPDLKISIEKQENNDNIRIRNNFTGEVYNMEFTEKTYKDYIKPGSYRKQKSYGDCVFVSFCNGLIRSEEAFTKYCSLFSQNKTGGLTIKLKNGDTFRFKSNRTLLKADSKENYYQNRGFLLLEQAIALSQMKSTLNLMMEEDLFDSKKTSKKELKSIRDNLIKAMQDGDYDDISQKLDDLLQKHQEFAKEFLNHRKGFQVDSLVHRKFLAIMKSLNDRQSMRGLDENYKSFLDIAFNPIEISALTGISLNFMNYLGTGILDFQIPIKARKVNENLMSCHRYNVLGMIHNSVYLQDTDTCTLEISLLNFLKAKLVDLEKRFKNIEGLKGRIESFKGDNDEKLDNMKQYYELKKKSWETDINNYENYMKLFVSHEGFNKKVQELKKSSQCL